MTNTPEQWSCLNMFLWFHFLSRSRPYGHVIAAAAASRDPAFWHKGSELVQMIAKRHETLKGRVGKRRRKPRKELCGSCTEKWIWAKKKWSAEEAMGGVGRKSVEDRVHKSSGGGRETKKMKMAGGIKSSMERRVKNWLGGWAREELLVASKRAVSACLACLETGWVRDMARGPNRVSVVIPCNFLQNINHGLSPSCSWARPATVFCRSAGQPQCSC